MSKHTPKPWRWITPDFLVGGENEGEDVLKASDDGMAYGMHSGIIAHNEDEEQAKANRSLIEAAPDLLEALRWYVDILDVDKSNEFWLKGRARALAAIAKAEGKE